MGAIEFYIEQLRLLWVQFIQGRLIKVLRDINITDKQAQERLDAHNAIRKTFDAWAVGIRPIRLHKSLSRVIKLMKILGIETPAPNKIVEDFLKSGELPEY
ncbi:MAG: hypothetical protein WC858_03665 [Parcubacteria group bacterium]|jgi:hypothetical protein